MSLHSKLTVTTLRTTRAPLTTVTAQIVGKDGFGNTHLLPMSATHAQRAGLHPFAGVATHSGGAIPGKSFSYRLGTSSVLLLVSVTKKTNKGATMRRTLLLRCGPNEEQGSVKLRYGGSLITLVSGPLQRLHGDAAMAILGSLYKPENELSDADSPRFGIKISGMTKTITPKAVRTRGEHGEEKTVFVKRAPRRIGNI